MDVKNFLKNVPHCPGVYQMFDKDDKLLYVGKAADLRKRLASYFYNKDSEPKIRLMLDKLSDIRIKTTESETEALIVESELIKKLAPKYNTLGRDDKSFPWVKITREDFPRVCVARPKVTDKARFIGPFTSAKLLKTALKQIRKVFPFCSCTGKSRRKDCLNYSLKLCPGPCRGDITKSGYRRNILRLCQILQGRRKTIIGELSVKMNAAAKEEHFEEAARLRDLMQALETLWLDRPCAGETAALWELKSLLGLKRLPLRIEGFDISNISGVFNVGSLVSFYKGQPDKSHYRRYRIKTISQANDYACILEMLSRRFAHTGKRRSELPDLILIDGGKAQVGAVSKALDDAGQDLAVVGIAKKEELLYLSTKKEPLRLSRNLKSLHILQRVRDEAHRFALKYHRFLRTKEMLTKRPVS